ncbi:polarity establishment/cellular polarization [Neodidymelliopsis sp. IMI 364377]|nr:polarity establishment/cellular polarization [Neodidymelliopsis sp. IMI 364377]
MEAKRSSYIRKRASALSPFFSAGYRASSSSYRSPPAFLSEKQSRSDNLVSPTRANTIVKPDDDVEQGKEKEVPASLNDLTGSEIYDNAELSESVYTDEEDDIDDYNRRTTVKPGQFTLPPLNLDSSRGSVLREKRRSKRNSQPKDKDNDNREMKRTSEREPTPHYLAKEHSGKENMSSSYTLGKITSIPETAAVSRTALSPMRPASSNTTRRSQVTSIPRKSILRDSQARPTSSAGSQAGSTKERHSRKSIHSRQQSRVSSGNKKSRSHVRSQSSAFPFFDSSIIGADADNVGSAITTQRPATKATQSSLVTRDLSGNLIYHGDETLGSSSIMLPQRHTRVPSGVPARQSIGLGLFPQGSSPVELNGERERNPLSVVGENVDVERAETPGKGRRTWGDGLKGLVARGSVWGWDKEKDDVKVFV